MTGGAGYIGSHTCKALARAGYTPVTYDNLVHGHRWAVKWGPLVEGDLADGDLLKKTMEAHAIRAVVHFAGYTYVGESMSAPGKYFNNNTVNTLLLLEGMRAAGATDIVFSSTAAIYGMPVHTPLREDHPHSPINPYGESKLFTERMLHWYANAYGIRWMALRYFNAAGADADGELGEVHDPETHLIPIAIEAALGKRERLDIFGTDYPTRDGTAIRDYIHVADLASAHVAALTALDGGSTGGVNLGTGNGYSVREVVAAVQRATGRAVPMREVGRRAGDPPVLVAAVDRARQVLAWEARHSSLSTIVKTAARWHEHEAMRNSP